MPDPAPPPPSRRRLLVLGGVTVLAVGGAALWWLTRTTPTVVRGFGDYAFGDPSRLYLGRADFSRRPAVVDSAQVYGRIPEYQQILREGLRDDVPKYHLLMVKATERFSKAVATAARTAGHDAVGEVGTIRPLRGDVPFPPDITAAVGAALP